jgi:protein TonB
VLYRRSTAVIVAIAGFLQALPVLILFSLLIHLIGLFWLTTGSEHTKPKSPVKVTVIYTPIKKKLIEVPLEKTEAPDKPKYQGAQDHKAKKETKVKKKNQDKTLDPGLSGTAETDKPGKATPKTTMQATPPKPRNPYEALLPMSQDLVGSTKSGYQDYIDNDDIDEGERIDMDTSEYRYIGYFTSFRKAFQLAWSYPREAIRRRLKGLVTVEFIINKNGSLRTARVVETSGFNILDEAVLEALEKAAPYNPVPDDMAKNNRLVVTGRFKYTF